MEKRILLWDDDIGWDERLRRELGKEEIAIQEAESREDLFVEPGEVLAVVLSEGQLEEDLPDEWQIYLKKVCESGAAPVLFVGEKEDEEQEMQAFLLGASDYISRTKDIRICAARVIACIGKKSRCHAADCTEWELTKDEEKCRFHIGTMQLNLTAKEYLVLSCLYAGRGTVVPRGELLDAAWGEGQPECKRVLDTVVKQLRYKLKMTGYVINAKYGMGYLLERNMSKKRADSGFYVG